MISRDRLLSTGDVGLGLTLWHSGVLLSVLLGGYLFDRTTVLQRIPLIAGPVLLNAVLFAYMLILPSAVEGSLKLMFVFVLGATGAPANYLMASTFISRHAPPAIMATISSIMDLLGYSATFLVLQGGAMHADNVLSGTLSATLYAALACCIATTCLYLLEHLHNRKLQGLGVGRSGGGIGLGGLGAGTALNELRGGFLSGEAAQELLVVRPEQKKK